MFAYQHGDIVPDIMTLAKPLANGIPIGATIISGKIADIIKPGDHGTTYFISFNLGLVGVLSQQV
jgi:acetylornithine/succinyldiaminopimelate/putrescine aminotransferase